MSFRHKRRDSGFWDLEGAQGREREEAPGDIWDQGGGAGKAPRTHWKGE